MLPSLGTIPSGSFKGEPSKPIPAFASRDMGDFFSMDAGLHNDGHTQLKDNKDSAAADDEKKGVIPSLQYINSTSAAETANHRGN